MDDKLFYMIIIMIVVADMGVAAFMNNQRKKLDMSKAEDVAKDKGLRLLVAMICAQAVIIPAILLFVVKPLLVAD